MYKNCHPPFLFIFVEIKLTLKGDEHTEWMGTERTTRHNRHARDRRSRSRTVLKTGNHNFMHTDIILIGNGKF